MYGADVAQLRALAARFEATANELDSLRIVVARNVQANPWSGPAADQFRSAWASTHSARLSAVARSLHDGADRLRANADGQESASGAGPGGRPGSSPKACMESAGRYSDVSISENGISSEYHIKDRWGDNYGGTWTTEETAKGGLHGHADADAGYDDAAHAWQAHAGAGAKEGWEFEKDAQYDNGLFSGDYGSSGFTGARVDGQADGGIGVEGAHASAGVNAFAGAEASVNAKVDYGGVGAGAEASVMAGFGAKASASAMVSADEISLEVEIGASFGVGASFKPSITIHPKEIIDSVFGFFGAR